MNEKIIEARLFGQDDIVAIIKEKIVFVTKGDESNAVVYLQGIYPNGKGIKLSLDIPYNEFIALLVK